MAISPRKLIKMARKWQKLAAQGRKRKQKRVKLAEAIIAPQKSPTKAIYIIVHTADAVLFSFPIAYLNTLIFRDLLRIPEEEFGPITLPCDSQLTGHVNSSMQKKAVMEVEKALLLSMAGSSAYYLQNYQQTNQQMQSIGC